MIRGKQAGDFERWLDRELPNAIAAELGPARPPAPRVDPRRSAGRRAIAGLGVRSAAAVLAVGLAVAGGGAALATGSPNPVSWGQHVVRAVSAGSLTAPRGPVPAPDAAPAPPGGGPGAPASHGQNAPDAQGADESNGNGGRSETKGGGDGGSPSEQGQNRPAKTHDDQQPANPKQ